MTIDRRRTTVKTIGWIIAWTQKSPDSGLIRVRFFPGPWRAAARSLWEDLAVEGKGITRARRLRVRG